MRTATTATSSSFASSSSSSSSNGGCSSSSLCRRRRRCRRHPPPVVFVLLLLMSFGGGMFTATTTTTTTAFVLTTYDGTTSDIAAAVRTAAAGSCGSSSHNRRRRRLGYDTRSSSSGAAMTTATTTRTTTRSRSTTMMRASLADKNMVPSSAAAAEEETTAADSGGGSGGDHVDEAAAAAAAAADRAAFLDRCRELCGERNLNLTAVKNARDLASANDSPVQPGRIYRMGRLGDATAADVNLLLDELRIKTLMDLRSPTELKDDPALLTAVFDGFTDVVWRERDGCVKELPAGQPPVQPRGEPVRTRSFWKRIFSRERELKEKCEEEKLAAAAAAADEDDDEEYIDDDIDIDNIDDIDIETVNDDDDDDDDDDDCYYDDCVDPDTVKASELQNSGRSRKERHFVSLMNEFKYVKGTVKHMRKRDLTKAILKSPGALVSRRVRTSVKRPFLNKINGGGLPMLNELLLEYGAAGIKYTLELIADPNRHPVAFYCTAGKDRTGMIAAIVLALCGADAESIVEDYTLSANVYAEMNDHTAMVGALSQRNLDPATFLGAPAAVMRDTLAAIRDTYGSVPEYCARIGFGPERQRQLIDACCTNPAAAEPAAAEPAAAEPAVAAAAAGQQEQQEQEEEEDDDDKKEEVDVAAP